MSLRRGPSLCDSYKAARVPLSNSHAPGDYLFLIMKPENIAALVDRVADIRILREHHVWAAADLLGLDGLDDERSRRTRRKFRELMEADALIDALLLLAASAEPSRSVENISNHAGHWVCSMRYTTAGTSRSCTAEHADLAAAVLASLLASFQQTSTARRRRVTPFLQHERANRHDTQIRDH
ncbi:hypothetical protein EDC40_102526 [Aminobacter aminovorans]|nr:hypothetical protein EDC40_102526 [Aminobacter aminovorans]